ncbi:MAG: hypothetical protein WCD35_10720, partial [Mycobacteriales bacterium]
AALCVASAQAAVCASSLPTWSVAALEAVCGVCVSLCFTVWETALQQHIPTAAQSRVSSFDYLGSLTLMPVGYALVGPTADALGTRTTALGATVVTAAVCLLVALSPGLRALRPGAVAVPAQGTPSALQGHVLALDGAEGLGVEPQGMRPSGP